MPKIKPTAVAAAVDTVRVNIESRSAVFNCRTDKEIAKKLNMPSSSYGDRKKNPRNWTLEQLIMVAQALKCTPQWLLTDHTGQITESAT